MSSNDLLSYLPTRSYLGPEFVHEALRTDKIGEASAKGIFGSCQGWIGWDYYPMKYIMSFDFYFDSY